MGLFENGYPTGCSVICHNNGFWAAFVDGEAVIWCAITKDAAERALWNHLHADDFWNNLPVVDLTRYERRG